MKKKINLRMIRNLLFFIGLIVLTFWLLFKDQDMDEIINVLKSADKNFIALGAILMFLYYVTESYNIRCVLESFGEKVSILRSLKYTFIGFFFSSITPAASGGQPVEMYYMTKENISGAKATMTLLIQLCGFQISTILLGIICAIINPSTLEGGITFLFCVGVTINGIALAAMLVCIFSKKLTIKLLNIFIKIMKLVKIKNVDEKKEKIEKGLEKYNESAIFIKTHKGEFVKAILRVFIQIAFYYSVPYCVYRAFELNTYNYFQIFSMQAVLYTTVSGLPLPGAVGVSETVFLGIFSTAFGGELIHGAMLQNRIITFYFYVILTLIVVIMNAAKTKDVKGEIDKQIMEIER